MTNLGAPANNLNKHYKQKTVKFYGEEMVPNRFLISSGNKSVRRADRMTEKYKVIIEKGEDGYYVGEAPELPGCYSQGKTISELMKNMKEAIELYLETKEELHQKPAKRFVEIGEVVVNA